MPTFPAWLYDLGQDPLFQFGASMVLLACVIWGMNAAIKLEQRKQR